MDQNTQPTGSAAAPLAIVKERGECPALHQSHEPISLQSCSEATYVAIFSAFRVPCFRRLSLATISKSRPGPRPIRSYSTATPTSSFAIAATHAPLRIAPGGRSKSADLAGRDLPADSRSLWRRFDLGPSASPLNILLCVPVR